MIFTCTNIIIKPKHTNKHKNTHKIPPIIVKSVLVKQAYNVNARTIAVVRAAAINTTEAL